MLQQQYEKHNLEMQPYHHYLAEYQKMDPRDISRHLEVPFDENTGLFQVKFMEKNYTVSHRTWRSIVWMKRTARQFYAVISMQKYCAPLFYRRRSYEGYRKSSFLS